MDVKDCASRSSSNNERESDSPQKLENGGGYFYVNKDGFPILSKTWDRMWNHVERIHPDGLKMVHRIRENPSLEKIPYATAPVFSPVCTLSVDEKLVIIQNYLQQLQYNHTGTQLFEIKKYRPYCGLMDTAREIIKESLPIKCLEAVVVSLYLTSGMPDVQRFAIGFKTQFGSNIYRHVVLGVYANGKYGALGLSRRDDLMYKPLIFKSVTDLLNDFTDSYQNYLHTVKKIKLSLPIVHDLHSCEKIHWKYVMMNPNKLSTSDMRKLLEKYSRELRTTISPYCATSPRKLHETTNNQAKSKNSSQSPKKEKLKEEDTVS